MKGSKPIREYALGIFDGPHATPKESDDGAIFLGIKNITEDGHLDFSEIRYIAEEDLPQWTRRVTPQRDDIVLSYEATLHRYAMIPENFRGCLGRRIALIRPDTSKVNPKFLLYYLLSPIWRRIIESSILSGATVDRIPIEKLPYFKVAFPDLTTQRKLAGILSAYDDLIENNLKRIALLEESARLLYKEWFVRLRFPGHEHTRIVDGVPEGWEKRSIADLCESINYGYTASAQQEEVGVKFLRITDIVPSFIDWSSVPYCEIPDNKKELFLLKEGDIVVARTGATVGYAKRMHKRHPETVFASYLVRLRLKKDIENVMIGVFVESEDYKNYIQAHIGGAAQPNANAKVISGASVLVPPKSIQQLFRDTVEASFDQREILLIQNQKLKQARDLLLPRLMNGEIPV